MTQPILPHPLPPERPRYVRVVSPIVGRDEVATLLSPTVVGVWTHWLCGRTHPHFSPPLTCPGCAENGQPRWKGYLAGWSQTWRQECLVELPEQTVRLSRDLQGGIADLRGYVIRCHRVGPHPNSIVTIQLTPPTRPLGGPPGDPDVLLILRRVWGIDGGEADHTDARGQTPPEEDEEVPLP